MPERALLVTDRNDGNPDLAGALEAVLGCRVASPDIDWSAEPRPGAIVFDLAVGSAEADRCMLAMSMRFGKDGPPTLAVLRDARDAAMRRAHALGAGMCLSALTPPRSLAAALLSHVHPGVPVVDRMVHRGVGLAGDALAGMFSNARDGLPYDGTAVRRGVQPLITAIQEGGLSRWLDRVWLHDDATYQHCLLVAGLAATFAVHAGFKADDRARFAAAALVHDVGKSRVPLEILNKPGKLEGSELTVMRSHAAVGHAILVEGGERDPTVLAAARHHHEMLDGSGYPDGLCAESIGDVVRLLTVCDVYAALVERRPYRDPMRPEEAIRVLAGMGHRIEQGFVDAFAGALLAPSPGIAA